MKGKKAAAIALLMASSICMGGCWDSVEIDRKAFVSTIAVDLSYDDENPVRVTYNFPDIRKMDASKGTADRVELAVDGHSITDAYIKAADKTSRSLHLAHSKLMLVSEDIYGKQEVMDGFIDYLERSPNINRAMDIAVVEGKAGDYLKVKPLFEDGIDNYIVNILSHSSRNGTFKPLTITDYLKNVKLDRSSILPLFVLDGENVELLGGDIIYNDQIVDRITSTEVSNIDLLLGRIGGCKKTVDIDDHKVDYYIKDVDKRLKARYEGGKLYLDYTVDCVGELSGYFDSDEELDSAKIREIEGVLNETMQAELLDTVNKYNDHSGADVLRIRENLLKYHKGVWNSVKDNLEEEVTSAEVSVTVNNKIVSVGISN